MYYFHLLLKNPQFYQTLFLLIVINLGILFYGLHFDYTKFFTTFISVLLFDLIFGYFRYGGWKFPIGGINAGFGISFFLRTDILLLYVLAAFLAVVSKYLFRVQDRHFFNPSNFGVFLVIVLFGWVAWTNPLQWGTLYQPNNWQFIGLIALLGFLGPTVVEIVRRQMGVNLWYLILPFLITHIFIYTTFTVENSFDSLVKFYTPAFLIFTFHMLTDPVIIMRNNLSKVFFGASIAIGFYTLQYWINENYSLLASLFLMTCLLPVIRLFDERKIWRTYTVGNAIVFGFFCLLFSLFLCMIHWYGYPDLVFDNRCNAILCR